MGYKVLYFVIKHLWWLIFIVILTRFVSNWETKKDLEVGLWACFQSCLMDEGQSIQNEVVPVHRLKWKKEKARDLPQLVLNSLLFDYRCNVSSNLTFPPWCFPFYNEHMNKRTFSFLKSCFCWAGTIAQPLKAKDKSGFCHFFVLATQNIRTGSVSKSTCGTNKRSWVQTPSPKLGTSMFSPVIPLLWRVEKGCSLRLPVTSLTSGLMRNPFSRE